MASTLRSSEQKKYVNPQYAYAYYGRYPDTFVFNNKIHHSVKLEVECMLGEQGGWKFPYGKDEVATEVMTKGGGASAGKLVGSTCVQGSGVRKKVG